MDTNQINLNDYAQLFGKYEKQLLDINIPIIGVFSSGENCFLDETCFGLYEAFISKNYKTSLIILKNTKEDKSMIHEFPFEIFNKYDDEKQIILFNKYIYDICKIDTPDLIIIEVPKGIIPIAKEATNGFGVLAYKITNAINFDLCVLNIYFDYYSSDFFDELERLLKYRFSLEYVFFNVIPKKIDWSRLREDTKIKLIDIDKEKVNKFSRDIQKSNVVIYKKDTCNILTNVMEDMLIGSSIVDII